jgi:hypothetical protein
MSRSQDTHDTRHLSAIGFQDPRRLSQRRAGFWAAIFCSVSLACFFSFDVIFRTFGAPVGFLAGLDGSSMVRTPFLAEEPSAAYGRNQSRTE